MFDVILLLIISMSSGISLPFTSMMIASSPLNLAATTMLTCVSVFASLSIFDMSFAIRRAMNALKYDDLSDFAEVSILRFGVLLVVFFSMRELL